MRYSPAKLPSADVVKTNAMVINDFMAATFPAAQPISTQEEAPTART